MWLTAGWSIGSGLKNGAVTCLFLGEQRSWLRSTSSQQFRHYYSSFSAGSLKNNALREWRRDRLHSKLRFVSRVLSGENARQTKIKYSKLPPSNWSRDAEVSGGRVRLKSQWIITFLPGTQNEERLSAGGDKQQFQAAGNYFDKKPLTHDY